MRPVRLGRPISNALEHRLDWIIQSLREIERASQEERTMPLGDLFTVTNKTVSRTLDCDTATVAQLSDVVGTLLEDMQERGVKRT